MDNKNLSELTVAELMKKEKDSKAIQNYMLAVLIISPIVIMGLFIQKQYGTIVFTTILSVFLPLFLIFSSKKQLRDIKAELEKRGNDETI
jgi:uncharacterized membrane protein